ncbi:unnamed protein product [Bursaphelenchus xylophilus]|uniref:(pine wood nematode) hypothetical protein n=1 Tax=Bursaphelenchus xylophilus TaxID=6326 RepID=A0A1I7RXI1_BURXY|nr:unnamed protein product [Bursaphelenchus xylophilus]CAG9126444.1 unnamed protein product [Bursaphelenchus xylophilus]
MTDAECQRFFALSKRVPKDVKRYCGICRQHGVMLETRGHTCQFKDCTCNKCELVRTRRRIMSQQIRLRRAQDKRFQRTNEPEEADVVPIKQCNDELRATNPEELLGDAKSMCYFCQKCKNHNILVWKKQHKKQCPFTDCNCEKCDLIETRRRLDQHMKKRRTELLKRKNLDTASPAHSSDDRSTPISVTSGTSASPKSLRMESLTPENPPTLIAQPKPMNLEDTFMNNMAPASLFEPPQQSSHIVQYVPVYIPVSSVGCLSPPEPEKPNPNQLLNKLFNNYAMEQPRVQGDLSALFNNLNNINGMSASTSAVFNTVMEQKPVFSQPGLSNLMTQSINLNANANVPMLQTGMLGNGMTTNNQLQFNCGTVTSLRDLERLLCLQHQNQMA